MRKDVRFGLTIGAILLAVLVVYVLVVPGRNEPDLVSLETLDPAGTSAEETESGPSILDLVEPPVTQTTVTDVRQAEAPIVTETPIAAAPQQQFDWEAMLTHGRLIAVEQTTEQAQPSAAAQPAPVQRTVARGEDYPALTRHTETSRATPTADSTSQTYIVKSGDNFWVIAQAVYGDGRHYKLIEQANPGVDSSNLKIGQELRIPPLSTAATPAAGITSHSATTLGPRQYRVQPNDSLHRIAQKLYGDGSRWQEIYDLNRQTIGSNPARLKVDMILQLPEEPIRAASR